MRLTGQFYTVLRQWPDGTILTDGERTPLQLTWLRTVIDIASDPDTFHRVVQIIETDLHTGTCRDVTTETMDFAERLRKVVPESQDDMPAIRNVRC